MSSRVERLRELLDELDVEPRALRDDPQGSSWLPDSARALCERDSACNAELPSFVAGELELSRLAQPAASGWPRGRSDPFFAARVVSDLPPPLPWMGLSPVRRMVLLSAFQLLAVGLAHGTLVWLTPEWPASVARSAHGWLGAPDATRDSSSVGIEWFAGLAAVVGLAMLAFASPKSRTVAP